MAMYSAQPATPVENIGKGTVVALLVIPVGVIVWVLVWQLGVVASIISFGVAAAAVFLYRLGSGGAVSRAGAIRIIIITAATILLSIFAGIVSDVAVGLGNYLSVSPFDALAEPRFWDIFTAYVTDSQSLSDLALPVLIGVAFGVLGSFSTLRNALRATSANEAAQAQASAPAEYKPITPTNPEDPTQR
jgi:hypothetical protein